MNSYRTLLATLCAVLVLGGCSLFDEDVGPSLTGDDRMEGSSFYGYGDSGGEFRAQGATDGDASFDPEPPRPGRPTGTFVGKKIGQLREDLARLQQSIRDHNANLKRLQESTAQNAHQFHGIVGGVNARLQMGTTPGNPKLVGQWEKAQKQLDILNNDITNMNSLANLVAADAALANYLRDNTHASYALSGAVEEDHRQLAILEDEVNRTVVLIDRLMTEMNGSVKRQTAYLASERENLNALAVAIKNGDLYGQSLANRAYFNQASATGGPRGGPRGSRGFGNRRPLVVIRFDRPNVNYEQALYTAVSRALDRQPGAMFDLVAVSPAGNDASATLAASKAKRHAEKVLRSLVGLGMPASRVELSAMNSANVNSAEVHLFVR